MARERKVLFAVCTRNCAPWLPSILHNIEQMASLFSEAAFVFVENDSEDATKTIIKSWCAQRKKASLISRDGLSSQYPVRTIRLAYARQEYIAILKAHFSSYTYLIVLDCDEVNSTQADLDTVRRAVTFLESDPTCAAVFANQKGVYYDLWALRHSMNCPGDVWEEVLDCTINLHLPDREAFTQTFSKRIFSLALDAEPLEVDSAFGGYGIYKVSSVLRNRRGYVGFKKKRLLIENKPIEVGWQVCEHVSFNGGFREEHERLFVLPYLVNFTTINQSYPPSAFRGLIFNLATMEHQKLPIRRNELCPCGSGKRFKHCHGALAN